MKVSPVLKGRKDDLGRRLLYIRISEGQDRTHKSLGVRLADSQFKDSRVINHPDQKTLNEMIRKEIMKAESGAWDRKPKSVSLKDYGMECLRQWRHSDETTRTYKYDLGKILRFRSVQLNQVTHHYLNELASYLFSIGNSGNTVAKSMKLLKTIIGKARREGLITINPFDLYKAPRIKSKEKVYLLREDIDKIEAFADDPTNHDSLRHVAAWFVIGCYTGLRFGDMRNFSEEKIKGGRLTVMTMKTGEIVSLPFVEKLQGLFKRVDYKPLRYCNQTWNRYLKTVAAGCGIREKITGHISRHTTAMMLAEAGVSQEVTAKILGHSNLKTTAIYYRITPNRIDEELKKIL